MTSLSTLWPAIERSARDAGAIGVGATPLGDGHAGEFEDWLARGLEGSMLYLRKNLAVRRDPHGRFPWARSAVAVAVPYEPERPAAPPGSIARHLARYALGDDYHEVLDSILRGLEAVIHGSVPDARSRRYVDTGPLSDRSIAAAAGLGWIGRNGMLIDPDHGSYFFIGVLLTSLELDLEPAEVADRCGSCTRCIDACPTEAILPGRLVDANLCISHATIEQRGAISEAVRDRLEGNLFGCDVCQEVCPWNESAPPGNSAFRARERYGATPVTDLLRISQSDFSSLFRKSAIKRARRGGMMRNAVLVTAEIEPATLASLREDPDPGVRDAAEWRERAGGDRRSRGGAGESRDLDD
ncbi:MAG TPA: tRNA epoxyqueuosine(34) reductase QueG [Thermoanaerobaculia bacterium]|nr:tRNA epoxyqueuosine(34) reductase QueG [Thermoanaerobaculia bacterium]